MALAGLSVVVVIALWVKGQGPGELGSVTGVLHSFGRLTALLASDLLLIQVLLMARVPFLEQAFGQDGLARSHRLVGFTSFTLMLGAHRADRPWATRRLDPGRHLGHPRRLRPQLPRDAARASPAPPPSPWSSSPRSGGARGGCATSRGTCCTSTPTSASASPCRTSSGPAPTSSCLAGRPVVLVDPVRRVRSARCWSSGSALPLVRARAAPAAWSSTGAPRGARRRLGHLSAGAACDRLPVARRAVLRLAVPRRPGLDPRPPVLAVRRPGRPRRCGSRRGHLGDGVGRLADAAAGQPGCWSRARTAGCHDGVRTGTEGRCSWRRASASPRCGRCSRSCRRPGDVILLYRVPAADAACSRDELAALAAARGAPRGLPCSARVPRPGQLAARAGRPPRRRRGAASPGARHRRADVYVCGAGGLDRRRPAPLPWTRRRACATRCTSNASPTDRRGGPHAQIVVALTGTVSVLVLLFSYHTSPSSRFAPSQAAVAARERAERHGRPAGVRAPFDGDPVETRSVSSRSASPSTDGRITDVDAVQCPTATAATRSSTPARCRSSRRGRRGAERRHRPRVGRHATCRATCSRSSRRSTRPAREPPGLGGAGRRGCPSASTCAGSEQVMGMPVSVHVRASAYPPSWSGSTRSSRPTAVDSDISRRRRRRAASPGGGEDPPAGRGRGPCAGSPPSGPAAPSPPGSPTRRGGAVRPDRAGQRLGRRPRGPRADRPAGHRVGRQCRRRRARRPTRPRRAGGCGRRAVADRRRGPAGPVADDGLVPLTTGARGDVRHRRTGCPPLRPRDGADGRPSGVDHRRGGHAALGRRLGDGALRRRRRCARSVLAQRSWRSDVRGLKLPPQLVGVGGRPVADEPPADVGRGPAVDQRPVGQQRHAGRVRRRRPPTTSPGRGASRAGDGQQRRRRPAPVPTTATWSGPAHGASADRERPAGEPRVLPRRPAPTGRAPPRRAVPVAGPTRSARRTPAARRPRPRPRTASALSVGSRGRAEQRLGVVGGVVEAAVRPSAKRASTTSSSSPAAREPARLAGGLVQREQPLGQVGVVLQHAGRLADHAVARGPGAAGRRPGAALEQDGRRAAAAAATQRRLVRAAPPGLGQRRDGQPVPGGDHLVVAGRLRPPRPGGEQPAPARRPTAPASSGSAGSCSVDEPCSKVPASVTAQQVGGPAPRRSRRAPRASWAGVQAYVRPSTPAASASRAEAKPPSACEVAQQELGGLAGDPPGQRRPGRPPQCSVDPQQQRVVVEHLLEVRHHPARVHRVAGEAAGQLVVHPAAGHRLAASPPPSPAHSASPVRAWWRSRNSSTIDGGNFGAPPKPPLAASNSGRSAAAAASSTAVVQRRAAAAASPARPAPRRSAAPAQHLVPARPPGLGDRVEQPAAAGAAGSRCRRRTARRPG